MSLVKFGFVLILGVIVLSQAANSDSRGSRTKRPRPGRPVSVRPTRRPTVARKTTQAPAATTVEPIEQWTEPPSVGCGAQATGFEHLFLNNPNQTRVINGQEAKAHSWPWVVVLRGQNGGIQCGGSLLRVLDRVEASDIFLTAAHCVAHVETEDLKYFHIEAGLDHSDRTTEYFHQRGAKAIRVHPSFGAGGSIVNDVALVKLSYMMHFNDGVRPVCLPRQGASIPTKQTCVAVGYGRNSSQNFSLTAKKLQQVIAPVHPADTCTSGWGSTYDENAMICAGELNGESGVCNGDSGSTLMCKEDDRWVQHGVVSFGVQGACLEANKPDVYARVSSYTDWIKQGIKEMSDIVIID